MFLRRHQDIEISNSGLWRIKFVASLSSSDRRKYYQFTAINDGT